MLLGLLKITRGVMKKELIKLTDNEIKILLSKLDGWSFKDGKISKKFNTLNWRTTLMVTSMISYLCEVAWHHPSLVIEFNTVTVNLWTHEISGISKRDFEVAKKIDKEIRKLVDEGYNKARQILTEKIDDLHKIAKALLVYETLSGDEIRDLILKDKKPTRSFENDSKEETKETSALGTIGLKPKPVV